MPMINQPENVNSFNIEASFAYWHALEQTANTFKSRHQAALNAIQRAVQTESSTKETAYKTFEVGPYLELSEALERYKYDPIALFEKIEGLIKKYPAQDLKQWLGYNLSLNQRLARALANTQRKFNKPLLYQVYRDIHRDLTSKQSTILLQLRNSVLGLQAVKTHLEQEVNRYQDSLAEKMRIIETKDREITTLKNDIATRDRTINELNQRISDLEGNLDDAQQDINAMRCQLKTNTQANKLLLKSIRKLELKIEGKVSLTTQKALSSLENSSDSESKKMELGRFSTQNLS